MAHYMDYAATSAIRPAEVVRAVTDFLSHQGGTPGRGAHRPALEAGRMALRTRRALLSVLGLDGDPGRVVFTHNATHALNLALSGVLRPGDRVVGTSYDHNAVRRPLLHLARTRDVDVRVVEGAPDGSVDPDAFRRAVDGARLVVLTAASNVLGTALPVADLARSAREAGALVLVDAAQSAGHLAEPLDDADLVAVTGHKALLGPQGTGALWIRPGVEVAPLLFGGSGGDSRSADMPAALPDRHEAGTLNAPGIAGLEAGCAFVLERGIVEEHRRLAALKARLHHGLTETPGVRVLSPPAPGGVPLVTFVAEAVSADVLAREMERGFGVQGRAGLHCAPGVHRMLGTEERGAFRLSLGWASTDVDVDRAVEAAAAIARSPAVPVGADVDGAR